MKKITFKELKESTVNNIPELTMNSYQYRQWFNLVKEFYEEFEKTWRSINKNIYTMLDRIVSKVWYTNIEVKSSEKKWVNFYNLLNKEIYLEPKCFEPKNFTVETVWLTLHETLHVYFSKWVKQDKYLDFIFDKNKPMFPQIFNVFEDIRINNMSKYFYLRWQDYIKLIYHTFWKEWNWYDLSKIEPKWEKVELMNYSIIQWALSIGNQEFNQFLSGQVSYRDKLRKVLPEETRLIDEFIEEILNFKFNRSNRLIREDGDIFVREIYDRMYHLIYDEQKQKEENEKTKENLKKLLKELEKQDKEKEKQENNEQNERNEEDEKQELEKRNSEIDEMSTEELKKEIIKKFWKNPFEWDLSEKENMEWNSNDHDQIIVHWENDDWNENNFLKVNSVSTKNWKSKSELIHWENTYKKIVQRNSIFIENLRSKLFQILEKRRTKIEAWYDRWKTISSRVLMQNVLKNKAWEIKRREILNWTFKRMTQEWKKILNLVTVSIDKSWSMGWNNMKKAKESAVIVIEALKRLDTIITVNAYDWENYTIYDWWYNNEYESVSSIFADWWTNEIETMIESMKQFESNKNKYQQWYHWINSILIILTDWYWDWEAYKKVKELNKKWVIVLWIWINENELNDDHSIFEKTYWKWNYFILNEVNDLPKLLPNLIVDNLK